jgi:hypothetical protein
LRTRPKFTSCLRKLIFNCRDPCQVGK